MRGYVVAKGSCFYAVIYEGVDPITGRERRRWHAAGPDRDAAEQMARSLAAKETDTTKPAGLTLAVYLQQRWLPAKKVSLRPSTWDSYRRRVVQHVLPRLGTVPLRRLRPEHLEPLRRASRQRQAHRRRPRLEIGARSAHHHQQGAQ